MMPVLKKPAPDHEINTGGTFTVDDAIFNATMLRVHVAEAAGFVNGEPGGSRTILRVELGAEVGSIQAFERAGVIYDGGVIHGLVELFGEADQSIVITTSGNIDWTLDGVAIAGFFIALPHTLNERHVLAGSLGSPPVAAEMAFVNHGISSAGGFTTVSVWTI